MSKAVLQICLAPGKGGLEKTTLEWAKNFQQEGFSSHICCSEGSFLDEEIQKNSPIGKLTVKPKRDYYDFKLSGQLKKYILKNNIKYVFVHYLKDSSYVKFATRRLKNLKVIAVGHMYVRKKKFDIFHKWVYGRFNNIVVFSEPQKQNLIKHLPIPNEKYLVIPHGTDCKRFSPADDKRDELRKKLGFEKNDFVTGVIGRFDPQKGQTEFIQAAVDILNKQESSRFKFLLLGHDTDPDNPHSPKLKELAKEYPDQIIFKNYQDHIEQIYQSLDVFVLPSYEETFGLVLIEAMACELPCIATNAGGVPDIITHNRDGLLIEPKSSSAIESALLKLINSLRLREGLGTNARLKVKENFDQKKQFSKIRDLVLK